MNQTQNKGGGARQNSEKCIAEVGLRNPFRDESNQAKKRSKLTT